MNISDIVKNAEGASVTKDTVDKEVIPYLAKGEQINYIFKSTKAVLVNNSRKAVSNMAEGVRASSKFIITNFGTILLQDLKSETTKNRVLHSDVSEFSIREPRKKLYIPIQTGKIDIIVDNTTYSAVIKGADPHELVSAKNYAENRMSNDINYPESTLGDSLDSLEARAKMSDIRVVQSYGVNLKQKEYSVEITEEEVKFIIKLPFVENRTETIETEEIDFREISVSSKRDFKKENRGRYVNQINPLVDDASPAAKKHDELVKIPLRGDGRYITVTPGKTTSISEILDGLSGIDTRADDESSGNKQDSGQGSSALETLKNRLAEGEITSSEFKEKRELLNENDDS